MKKILPLFCAILLSTFSFGQSTTLSTYPTIAANNGFDQVLFEITPNQDIILESVASVFNTGTSNVSVYVRAGGYPNPPGATSAANGWTIIGTALTTATSNAVPTAVPMALNYYMASGNTYGIAIYGNTIGSRYHTHVTTDPNSYTDGTVTIDIGTTNGWGGAFPTPANNPRDFVGSVTYSLAASGPNNAGVSKIVEPGDTCTGQYDVKAEIKNYGTNQISQVNVNWSINGILQSPVAYTSLLDTNNGLGASSAIVTLGSVTLPANSFTDIAAWTSMPNGVVDTAKGNDSSIVSLFGYPFPTINLGPNTTICPGDPLTLDAGVGRDSIIWSNTSTNQTINVSSAGSFNVKVYENGCESRDTIVVSVFPQPPAIDLGPDTTLCFGESLLLDATTAGVTYLWQDNSTNPTFTVSTAGVYSVELEDGNGCKSSDGINVTYYLEPNVTIYVAPSNNLCYGVEQTFTAFPLTQGSIDYQWKINGVNVGPQTTSATFNGPADHGDTVTVDLITDICATDPYPVPSNKIGMTVNPKPKNVTGKTIVRDNTTETYVVPLSSGSAYVWRVVGGTISGDSTKNIVTVNWGAPNPNGKIILVEKDSKNCERENIVDVKILSIVGIDNIAEGFGMGDAYPNPSNNLVNIPIHADQNRDITLQLFDMTGKMVKTLFHGTITGNKNIQVSVDDLNNGVYIYKLTTPNGYMSVKKLTVEH